MATSNLVQFIVKFYAVSIVCLISATMVADLKTDTPPNWTTIKILTIRN